MLLDALRLKNISTEKLALATGISERFIELLLEERYEKLPPAPYLRGYLLKISDVLNIDGERLWDEYLKSHEAMRRSGPKDILPSNRFEIAKLNKKIIFGILIFAPLAYFAVQAPNMVGRPQLYLANLEDNMIASEAIFTVSGKIKPTDSLTINGQEVFPQENGEFTKIVNLNSGFNTIVFKVKRFLGKENVIIKNVYYEPVEVNQ